MSLPYVEEDMPYGNDWVVFRIGGKIFLHIWLEAPIPTIAVKLLPERGEELREEYNAFSPAYYLNKKHWNDIFYRGHFSCRYDRGMDKGIIRTCQKQATKECATGNGIIP